MQQCIIISGIQIVVTHKRHSTYQSTVSRMQQFLARNAQAKLALIVAQCLSIHLSISASVRDSLSHAYVRSIARRVPPRLPACFNYGLRKSLQAAWISVWAVSNGKVSYHHVRHSDHYDTERTVVPPGMNSSGSPTGSTFTQHAVVSSHDYNKQQVAGSGHRVTSLGQVTRSDSRVRSPMWWKASSRSHRRALLRCRRIPGADAKHCRRRSLCRQTSEWSVGGGRLSADDRRPKHEPWWRHLRLTWTVNNPTPTHRQFSITPPLHRQTIQMPSCR